MVIFHTFSHFGIVDSLTLDSLRRLHFGWKKTASRPAVVFILGGPGAGGMPGTGAGIGWVCVDSFSCTMKNHFKRTLNLQNSLQGSDTKPAQSQACTSDPDSAVQPASEARVRNANAFPRL